MKISACMITKNEERCIERCISSYKNAVDEIVVLDTGSTDKTKQIAKSLGAAVYDFEWQNDFALAKNAALEKANGDWVIFLDADEYFEAGCAARLRMFIENTANSKSDIDGVHIRRYEILSSAKPTEFVSCLRAFRLAKNIRYKGEVHEYVVKDDTPVNTLMAPVDKISIMHDGYLGELNLQKMQRNIVILQKMIDSGNPDPYLHYYMGQSLAATGEHTKIYAAMKSYLENDPGQTNAAMSALVECLNALERMNGEKAAELEWLAAQAVKRYPAHPTAQLIAASCRYELEQNEQALDSYKKAFGLIKNVDESEPSKNRVPQRYHAAYTRAARLERLNGNMSDAEKFCIYALELEVSPAAFGELALCTKAKNVEISAPLFLKYYKSAQNPEPLLDVICASRFDMIFLFLYDDYSKPYPPKDRFLTQMQLLMGQAQPALKQLLADMCGHALWQGGFSTFMHKISPHEAFDFNCRVSWLTAAFLFNADAENLKKLIGFCPKALESAIRLCTGEEIETFEQQGKEWLAQVEKRLVLYGANEEVLKLWQSVMQLAENSDRN